MRVRAKMTGLAAASLLVTGLPVLAGGSAAAGVPDNGCRLGNGVRHVINIVFDNVHFFRDNPNVPSDVVMVSTLRFVRVSIALTVAPGTAAPDGSCTVPLRLALVV